MTAAVPGTAGECLSVIALVSGGKDSFYSILHCQANGHRVVALANLYPSGAAPLRYKENKRKLEEGDEDDCNGETDLNSFMYQTVGHQVIPLYAEATGLPLYRRPILGTAVHHGLSYENPRRGPQSVVPLTGSALGPLDLQGSDEDETESLVPLLRAVLRAHPEANALCSGAILSTYQRTRVESVALRLGLVPLSYLWQFTELPASVPGSYGHPYSSLVEKITSHHLDAGRQSKKKRQGAAAAAAAAARNDARLLHDMAATGLEARIIKVASAGLDEGFLWENVASEAGVNRVKRAMRRFGAGGGRGSILGEGGEFETLVIDGPPSLFQGRIIVQDEDRRVIREGGGCEWLSFRGAHVVMKEELEQAGELQVHYKPDVRIPELLDPRFEDSIRCLLSAIGDKQKLGFVSTPSKDDHTKPTNNLGLVSRFDSLTIPDLPKCQLPRPPSSQEWCYLGSNGAGSRTVEEQTVSIVEEIGRQLDEHSLPVTAITNSVIVLRHMSDFPLINERYGSLFSEPNPPSRVTISCGEELLPNDAAIAVYLTVQLCLQPHERRGLHVQSRSYWAPANIGPYSQAVAFPLLPLSLAEDVNRTECEDVSHSYFSTSSSALAVSIAGQIPLLPASMVLPPPATPHHVELRIILALQHLWRVGTEMQVRWWTSAVAYFPATPSTEVMHHQALLAATAWKTAHVWPNLDCENNNSKNDDDDDDDDDDAGPDLWDQRYNAQLMTYSGGDENETFPLPLPDWGVLKGFDEDAEKHVLLHNKITHVPFFFAAEVEELPRQAGVEWHAHLGLAELQAGSIALYSTVCDTISSSVSGLLDLELHHVVVVVEHGVFVQTTAALRSAAGSHDRTSITTELLRSALDTTVASLKKLLKQSSVVHVMPKITYTDSRPVRHDGFEETGALIPCRSLWDSQGRRLGAVCIFETRAARVC